MGNSVHYKDLQADHVYVSIQDGFKKQWIHLDEEEEVTYIIENPTGSKRTTLIHKLGDWEVTNYRKEENNIVIDTNRFYDYIDRETKEVIIGSNYITVIDVNNYAKTMVFDIKIPITESLQPYRIL